MEENKKKWAGSILTVADVDEDVIDPVAVPPAGGEYVVPYLPQAARDVGLVPDIIQRQRVQNVPETPR